MITVTNAHKHVNRGYDAPAAYMPTGHARKGAAKVRRAKNRAAKRAEKRCAIREGGEG